MTAEEKLQGLMKQGYHIDIQCKSAEREFALTYEAHARKNSIFSAGHATGSTLDELTDNLILSINLFSIASSIIESGIS